MEINENDIQLYQKGFNAGYLIAKYEPEISAGLTTKSESLYMQGFVDGQEEWKSEKLANSIDWNYKPDRQAENDFVLGE